MNITGFDPLTAGVQAALDLRHQQHVLTSSNLANVDTPGYLAKQISFESLLADAVDSAERGFRSGPAEVETLDAPPGTLNGNSVSPEREVVRLTENSLVYNALTTGLSQHLGMLRFAASNGRS
jgi:flagellar basal-body rod protein FlgB